VTALFSRLHIVIYAKTRLLSKVVSSAARDGKSDARLQSNQAANNALQLVRMDELPLLQVNATRTSELHTVPIRRQLRSKIAEVRVSVAARNGA
jgi:hypothetical protein